MHRMKARTSILFLSVFFLCTQISAQVPLATHDVILQGFCWNSFTTSDLGGSTKWSELKNQVQEISASFNMIWLPPSSLAEGGGTRNMGYHPREWSNQNSSWGTVAELKSLIQTFHQNNCKVLADIVINHRAGKSSWNNFMTDNYGSGYNTYQLEYTHICKDDEAKTNGYLVGNNYDYNWNVAGDLWGGYAAARDLDHSQQYVRDAIKEYMQFLKNDIGYDGWRYDMTKGYDPKYTKEYNDAAGAYFSVGEYWQGEYNRPAAWVMNAKYSSTTFDFLNKYAIQSWNGGTNFLALTQADGEGILRPKGLIQTPAMRQYAVTFVDNHDTAPPHSNPQNYTGDISKAYAYLLSNPGIPCVFWQHWITNKINISQMIAVRKRVGLNSNSDVRITNTKTYYESKSIGTNGELICRIGVFDSNGIPDGYTLACSGNSWAYYSKITSTKTKNITFKNHTKLISLNHLMHNILRIVSSQEVLSIQIITPQGRIIKSASHNDVLISDIERGAFLAKITFIDNSMKVEKFVK